MFLLVPSYPGSPGPTAVKQLCVCVCVRVRVRVCVCDVVLVTASTSVVSCAYVSVIVVCDTFVCPRRLYSGLATEASCFRPVHPYVLCTCLAEAFFD